MDKHLYKSGLPFSSVLELNIHDLCKRVHKKKASLIIVDGMIGEGKTTLAVEIADEINKFHKQPPIIFHEQLGIGGEEFQERLRVCYYKKLHSVIYDESGDFNRRGALTKFNASLNRTFETYRALKIIPILCLPAFYVLDKDLFYKGIPRLLLHVSDRGDKQGNFSGYPLSQLLYLKHRIENAIAKPIIYNYVPPLFYGHFKDLEGSRSRELEKYSIRGKLEILGKTEAQTSGLETARGISVMFGMGLRTIKRYISELSLKPAKIIRRTHYFERTQIAAIEEHIASAREK